MSDIVEELREYAVGSSLPVEQELIQKAVDEIEKLRRDVRTAVMGDSAELQDVKRENKKLHREAAIRIDQIEREQEAHLKTMADLNKQAEMNGRLLTENAELRAENEALKVSADRHNEFTKVDMDLVADLAAERNRLRERLAEADEANRRVSDENEKLREKNDYLRLEKERLGKDVYNLIVKKDEARAENETLRLELEMQQATILVPSQKDDQRRIERLNSALKEALDEAARLRRAMHGIYEVYAGCDELLVETSRAYLEQLLKEMSDIAAEHKK